MEPKKEMSILEHVGQYRANEKLAFLEIFKAFGLWLTTLALFRYGYIHFSVFVVGEILSFLHIFMLYHDMGHGSFFPHASWNTWGEFFLSFVIMTPLDWAVKHKVHHSGSGDLNKGPSEWNDTIFLTVEQYRELPKIARIGYRVMRTPLVFFTVIPFLNWFVKYRLPFLETLDPAQKKSWKQVYSNSIVNTVGTLCVLFLIQFIFGTRVVKAHVLCLYLGAVAGILLFHLQHAYNPSYTTRENWNLKDSAIKGSSFITIPFFLKTWTMGIEYHHIHHYSSRLPGYLLQKCHEEAPEGMWKDIHTLSYGEMFKSLSYVLYDEKASKFVSFGELDKMEAQNIVK